MKFCGALLLCCFVLPAFAKRTQVSEAQRNHPAKLADSGALARSAPA